MMRSTPRLGMALALGICVGAPAASAHPFGSWGWGGPSYGYGGMPGGYWVEQAPPRLEYGSIPDAAREHWLADCRGVLAESARGVAVPESLRGSGEEPCLAIMRAYETGSWPAGSSAAPFGYVMAPVTMVPAAGAGQRDCVETVTEEFIPAKRRSRAIPPRAKPAADKRVRLR